MVHVLDVVVILEHVDEFLHVLDIGLVGQSDVVLGNHLHVMTRNAQKTVIF